MSQGFAKFILRKRVHSGINVPTFLRCGVSHISDVSVSTHIQQFHFYAFSIKCLKHQVVSHAVLSLAYQAGVQSTPNLKNWTSLCHKVKRYIKKKKFH